MNVSRKLVWPAAALFALTALLPAQADLHAGGMTRALTMEQAIEPLFGALRESPEFPGQAEIATQPVLKSVANGLVIDGTFGYDRVGSTVTLTASQISNDSSTRTTGTLRLELWATTSRPARGAGFTGFRLATGSTLSPLSPRTFYSNVSRTTSFSAPPDGTYVMVLVLSEYSSTGCSNADGFCLSDSGVFTNTQTFGVPPPTTVTLVAAASGLCVENYPTSAADLLQQSQPGVYTRYAATATCSSLGFPFFAGNFAQYPELRAYTSTQSAAQSLCSSGLVISCTATAPPAANYTDLWYNANESGWGVAFVQHASGIAFAAWYTYDGAGNPKWYVASNCRVSGSGCSGTLYETNGPPLGGFFDPSRVVVRTVGTISFSFANANAGTMSYSVNGITGTKSITRQGF